MTYGSWMRLSAQVGLPLRQTMKAVTWREYRTWLEVEKRRWPQPGPIDRVMMDPVLYFLARVGQRVQQVLSKEPGQILLDDQLIQFEEPEEPLTEEEKADKLKRDKGLWKGIMRAMGGKIKYKTRPRNNE